MAAWSRYFVSSGVMAASLLLPAFASAGDSCGGDAQCQPGQTVVPAISSTFDSTAYACTTKEALDKYDHDSLNCGLEDDKSACDEEKSMWSEGICGAPAKNNVVISADHGSGKSLQLSPVEDRSITYWADGYLFKPAE